MTSIVEVQKLNRMAEENLEQGMRIASELNHEMEPDLDFQALSLLLDKRWDRDRVGIHACFPNLRH